MLGVPHESLTKGMKMEPIKAWFIIYMSSVVSRAKLSMPATLTMVGTGISGCTILIVQL